VPWSALPVCTERVASPQVPSLLPHVLSLSLPVLLSFGDLSLSLLSVAGFTDNSNSHGSESAGLFIKAGATGRWSGP
jgi:hypothetical protein